MPELTCAVDVQGTAGRDSPWKGIRSMPGPSSVSIPPTRRRPESCKEISTMISGEISSTIKVEKSLLPYCCVSLGKALNGNFNDLLEMDVYLMLFWIYPACLMWSIFLHHHFEMIYDYGKLVINKVRLFGELLSVLHFLLVTFSGHIAYWCIHVLSRDLTLAC